MASPNMSIGQKVRVSSGCGTYSAKAIISLVNDDNTLDIVWEDATGPDEESGVARERVRLLEAFEEENPDKDIDSYTLKDRGALFFELKDYHTSQEYFLEALKALVPPPSTGSVFHFQLTSCCFPLCLT